MSQSCPECGTQLPADDRRDLCVACLLKRGLETNTVGDTTASTWTPPSLEEVAAKFPELEVARLIGRGGMGAVYQARQKNLDRLVALKILPPEIATDSTFAERFAREAQAMAKLNHPHIVAIHEFGERGGGGGWFYFLMEYVDGLTLRTLLDTGHVSAKEALAIVPQICDALQYAHDQGIVHRDIKPENILLSKQGQVKIADFGLAKLMGHASSDPALRGAGASEKIMGTPHYMAPEQLSTPTEVDHRADIYSLGVVFYQMLTGELPRNKNFEAPSKRVQIDVRLDEIVLKALEREPQKRYQQVSEVKTMVETIVMNREQPKQPESPIVPTPPRRISLAKLLTTLIIHGLLYITFFALCLYVTPSFIATFRGSGMLLPVATRATISFSRAIQTFGCLLLPLTFLFGVSIPPLLYHFNRHILFRIYSAAVTLVLCITVLFMAFSLGAVPGAALTEARYHSEATRDYATIIKRERAAAVSPPTDFEKVVELDKLKEGLSQSGANPVARLKLQAAQEALDEAKGRWEMGIITSLEYNRAQAARDIAAAELANDPAKVALVKWQQAEREFQLIRSYADLDKVSPAELREAKLARDIAAAATQPASTQPEAETITVRDVPPVVVETWPRSGSQDVEVGEAGEVEIWVRFSKTMNLDSWSWSSAWEGSDPKIVGVPSYDADHRTCRVKVKLEPGRTYAFWLNSEKFDGFRDWLLRPAVPYLLIFKTKERSE